MATYNLSTLKSFPSAIGFGKNTTGGRGQSIYKVTTLSGSATGQGSIRDAVSGSNRIIVFTVAGTINLFEAGTNGHLYVYGSNLTIAGETAPGDGICLYGHIVDVRGNNIICRHIRVRSGNPQAGTGRQTIRISSQTVTNQSNIIFDHCSFSWGDDETFSIASQPSGESISNVTVQNSIISENFGTNKQVLLWGTNISNISFIKNYLAHTYERNIRCSTSSVTWEMQDNYTFHYGGALDGTYGNKIIAIGNVWETNLTPYQQTLYIQACSAANCPPSGISNPVGTEIFYDDNLYNGGAVTTNSTVTTYKVTTKPFDSGYTSMGSASVKTSVLNNAGARRGINNGLDALDTRIVNDAINGTNTSSYPSTEAQAGGLPTLTSGTYAADSLILGIPNTFVQEHGITSASQIKSTWTINGHTINNIAGYTAIEIYLFSLTGDLFLSENLVTVPIYTHNTLKAFPTADGFGKYATGGRGGTVIKVTNLNASGSGSFLAAIQATGNRTIVFTVSGTISYGGTNDGFVLPVGAGNCTIAGETSPGGIAIKGARFWVRSGNFICRHMRFHQWPGNVGGNNNDTVTFDGTYGGGPLTNMIFDHCSVSYGTDGNMDIRNTWGATVQYCLFYGNDKSNLINANSKNISYIKNVWSATYQRAVRANTITHTDLTLEQINNIIHCVPWNAGITLGLRSTFENNVFTWSTAYGGTFSTSAWGTAAVDPQDNEPNECCPENTYIYLSGNVYDASRWTSGIVGTRGNPYIQSTPYYRSEYVPISTTGLETYLLANVGAGQNTTTQGGRTALDQAAINNVSSRLGDPTVSSGAFPTLGSGTYPTDTTIPGIPNTFVTAHGISSANEVKTNWDFGSYQVINNAGYTALEIYLFTLTGDITAGEYSEGIQTQIGKTLKSLRFGTSKGKKFYQGNTILKRAKLG